jgi:Heparinase II/III-like protein
VRSSLRLRLCGAALLVCAALAAQPAAIQPYTWTENFQAGNLGQFSSYPPAQDAGYDPTIAPAAGGALVREVRPSRSGPARFGFIRRLDMVSAAGGRMSFSYQIDHTLPEDGIEVGIAGADGRRYSATIAIAPGGWRTAQISVAHLVDATGRAMPPHNGIEALFLVANLKHADADITYRFLIRALSLEGGREMGFDVRRPQAARIAHWPELFSRESFDAGQAVRVQVAAPVALTKADCTSIAADGSARGTWPLRDDGHGIWAGGVPAAATPGIETLLLRGSTTDGRAISTRLRVLRLATRMAPHPRLFFGAEDRQRLAARIQDPQYAPIWRGLAERAEAARHAPGLESGSAVFALLDPVFLLPTLPGYFDIVNRAGPAIELNALVAYLTGNTEAREVAKSSLLAVARWNSWAPPWFRAHGQQTYYPAGLLAVQAAFGYDLLYDSFTAEQRALIRSSLLEYAIARPYREYVEDNRIPANTSNWIGHTVGGALIAVAALWGDDAAPPPTLYINGLLRKFEDHLGASYLADGSYGEGISYQEFDLQTTALAMNAAERVFGIDYWSRSHVADSLWYPIATLAVPVTGSLDIGDSHPPAGSTIAPVVAHSRNPAFRWYYDHFPHQSLADFLFADFSIPSRAPPPGSRYFPDKGSVVLRSGSGEDGVMLLYRAGPNFNHNHADQGSFLLRAFGENLVTEAGYSDYYKDPYYDSYFKQAIGHNTVLVDGDPESQEVADNATFRALNRYPRITDVLLSPQVDAVASELQQVYRGRLRRFERRIVTWDGSILVYDNLQTAEAPARFDWLLHLPDRAGVQIENGGAAIYRGSKASLAIHRLFPADASFRMENGHLPYAVFNPAAPASAPSQPALLKLTANSSSGRARFLVELSPAIAEERARWQLGALNSGEDPNWIIVDQTSPHQEKRILFRREPSRSEAANGPWSTDAALWMVNLERPGGRIEMLAAQSATILKRGGQVLFSSTRPVSFAAEYAGGEIRLTVNATARGRIRVARRDGSLAEVEVAAGPQQMSIR